MRGSGRPAGRLRGRAACAGTDGGTGSAPEDMSKLPGRARESPGVTGRREGTPQVHHAAAENLGWNSATHRERGATGRRLAFRASVADPHSLARRCRCRPDGSLFGGHLTMDQARWRGTGLHGISSRVCSGDRGTGSEDREEPGRPFSPNSRHPRSQSGDRGCGDSGSRASTQDRPWRSNPGGDAVGTLPAAPRAVAACRSSWTGKLR